MSFPTVTEKMKGLTSEAEKIYAENVSRIQKNNEVTPETRQQNEAALARAKGTAPDTVFIKAAADVDLKAKYKIEVTFEKGRTIQGPNLLGIQVWTSGTKLNGGGDELCFFCKDVESDAGCWGIIPGDAIRGGVAICPHCQKAVNSARLTNMKIGRATSQNLAKELATLFRQLGSNAEIYLKYHKTDPRYVAMERAKGPEVAKKLKGMHIYPLKNIIKDTSSGADVGKRFYAFITS